MNNPKIVSPLGFTPKPDLNSDPDSQWDDILDAGEKILWQGRPDGAFTFSLHNNTSFFGWLYLCGFAPIYMIIFSDTRDAYLIMGLLYFCVGIYLIYRPLQKDAITRRYTWYTLTNTRAFIATAVPKSAPTLKSYEITPATVINFRPKMPATIYFAERAIGRDKNLGKFQIGFQRIESGEEVYRLIRDIQKDTA